MRRVMLAATAAMVIVSAGAVACGSNSSSGGKPSTPAAGKKLKGTQYCRLLSAESLAAIGVQASDAKPPNDFARNPDDGCEWQSGQTNVLVYVIPHMSIAGTDIDRKINVSGFDGGESDSLGNSCQVSMQVNDDELEVNVENDDSSNQALKGKACDVARNFTQQALAGVAHHR